MRRARAARTVGHASPGLTASHRSLPPEALLPVFDRMVEEGYLTRQNGFFSLTRGGQREADVISAAWAQWLGDRLERDRGRPRSAEPRAASDAIAKRLLAEALREGNFAPRPG